MPGIEPGPLPKGGKYVTVKPQSTSLGKILFYSVLELFLVLKKETESLSGKDSSNLSWCKSASTEARISVIPWEVTMDLELNI